MFDTIRADDPSLDVRTEGYDGRQPRPVIIAGRTPLPDHARIWAIVEDEAVLDTVDLTVSKHAYLTLVPNELVATVHDRMPISLDRDVWPVWLDLDVHDAKALQSLLTPSLDLRDLASVDLVIEAAFESMAVKKIRKASGWRAANGACCPSSGVRLCMAAMFRKPLVSRKIWVKL